MTQRIRPVLVVLESQPFLFDNGSLVASRNRAGTAQGPTSQDRIVDFKRGYADDSHDWFDSLCLHIEGPAMCICRVAPARMETTDCLVTSWDVVA